MPEVGNRAVQSEKPGSGTTAPSVPSISLPKGGGAIRGMGEKFAANPVTGTGSMSVPIATSPGRGGFGPQLSISYDSGAGNGPFGLGWSLGLPHITRRTDQGLPHYDDASESDVFLLSGAEDLVPVAQPDDTTTVPGYTIRRYLPRIEGLFARIERWTKTGDPSDVHWRSISKNNILTLYGEDENSRIADPADASHIFTWLICETRDDKGNAILYEYQAEDGKDLDLTQAHEANRGDANDGRRKVNRYIKHIRYGPRTPLLVDGRRPRVLTQDQIDGAGWMFEVVFDYGEHDETNPTPGDSGDWKRRNDPFSSYRAGFEVRTYRLCQRVLMFHHFPEESEVGADCLVRSTDLTYSYEEDATDVRNPIYSCLMSVTHSGYVRQDGGYLKRSLPPVVFEYTQPIVQNIVEEVDAVSLENLPAGLGGGGYQWTDLHGEGIPGILTEQGGAWFYKRNLSPVNIKVNGGSQDSAFHTEAKLGPAELVATKPNLSLADGAQFMDLAGDGLPDLVVLDGPLPGLYEHDEAESWETFRPFNARLERVFRDPNLRLVDLDGDGHADVLITEDDAFVWHPSLAEEGFGPAERVAQPFDEEKGPRLVFADGEAAVYLADLSGDGLTDLARVRNGEVCYWPNLGYGRFGAKVTMDNAPWFDTPDGFDQKRVRLADIDGSGTTDIIYLHPDGVQLYFNQSGNGWGGAQALDVYPEVDSLTDVVAADLLGNGTACLVWSSPLPGDGQRQMRYVNLMGDEKPHLLVKTVNNLGAETRVRYAPSTKFYLQDKLAGQPWITRLPFPVHVVERVEIYDHVSRNRFVTTYAYHHGYFDGVEREFRGFGMAEQTDTEEFAVLTAEGILPASNEDAASHVPPVLTRTWFHTGIYLGRDRVSNYFAGLDGAGRGEYYREPHLDDNAAAALLLPDTILPDGLTLDEEREAARSLKGMMLRQEVYALDGVGVEPDYPFGHPYTVAEQNFAVRLLQPQGERRHAVFLTHPREVLTFHYERDASDPRTQHALTLEVDEFGDVLKAAAIGYGRRQDAADSEFLDEDRRKQRLIHITATENTFTSPVDDTDGNYRTPLPAESVTYELRKLEQEKAPDGITPLYRFEDVLARVSQAGDGQHDIAYEDLDFARAIQLGPAEADKYFRRPIERVRTLYRKDDLTDLLATGSLEPLALPGESYKLTLTPGLLGQVFKRKREGQPDEDLLPTDLASLLEGQGADAGGYTAIDGGWWIPSGRVFYSPGGTDAAAAELTEAQAHFFLPRRFRDPFGHEAKVDYDAPSSGTGPAYDLLVTRTEDAVANVARAENDYRVLSPRLLTDPNGNRAAVAFDALGMVAGTAVMGKAPPEPVEGDSLAAFRPDLDATEINAFFGALDPHAAAVDLLKDASTRTVYDLDRFQRTQQDHPQEPAKWLPACAATLARETHVSDLNGGQTRIQLSFSCSDGFGREIQKKIQAEPGPTPQRDSAGRIIIGPDGQPLMTATDTNPRWAGSGWTVFSNKGKPVRQYEPFFTDTHDFEFDVRIGVSPVLFYDPVERVVATLHPDHTWEKVVFDPWQQATFDVNDTVISDPAVDGDVKSFFVNPGGTPRLPADEYLPTWHALRTDPALAAAFAAQYPDPTDRANETSAAAKAALHAGTPTIAHFDALGRPFLTLADNGPDPAHPAQHLLFDTRVELDIEGNQRAVRDAIVQNGDRLGRIVMRYDYDMLGNRIHQASMEAGERWVLNDVTSKPIRAFDSRGHEFRSEYDALRRPTNAFLVADGGSPQIIGRTIYGETLPNPESNNLRARAVEVRDQAGIVTTGAYDFKGNLLHSQRRLAREYKSTLDWSADVPLEGETFTSSTRYDALNRPIQVIPPHGDRPGTKVSIVQPRFNEANLLEQVSAWLEQAAEPAGLLDPTTADLPAVQDIDYDAKGLRTRLQYGNASVTTYDYDPLTFRLRHLLTVRGAERVQDLRYTYDPAGNITHIRDDAQQTVFFANQVAEPSNDYTYDAIYRLIEATGREHLGQAGGQPIPHSYNDAPRVGVTAPGAGNGFHPNDGNQMASYCETYLHDGVGNFVEMRHHVACPGARSWTRTYVYDEPSLLEPGKTSNRLSSTQVGNGTTAAPEQYAYDAHGSMLHMPQLQVMQYDFRDQMQMTQRQAVNDADADGVQHQGERTYYVYDAGGQRVRKVTERQAPAGQTPTRMKERLYLGGFEVYREYENDGATVDLERETLHIMDDKQRVALIETRTIDTSNNDPAPRQLIRYQYGNHLGSASLELDDQAQIISYEEYSPYGSTTYQAVRSGLERNPKRYRYTGMERDEESGLNYHTARYYAPWLGRWTATDPIGVKNSTNLYRYSDDNPIIYRDVDGMETIPGDATGHETLDKIREIAKNAGFGFRRPPVWDPNAGEHGMWDFGENNLYKLTKRFDPGPPETVKTGSYSTNPHSGEDYDPFAHKKPGQSGQRTPGHSGGESSGGTGGSGSPGRGKGGSGSNEGGEAGGTRRSGPPGGSAKGTGQFQQTGNAKGTGEGSSSESRDGWGWIPEVVADIILAVTLAVAAVTVVGFVLEFSAALAEGLTLYEAATYATGASMTGIGATGVGAVVTEEEEEGGAAASRTFYHYTNVDPAKTDIPTKGMWSQSSFTTEGNMSPSAASTRLGIPSPRWLLEFEDDPGFRPLGSGIVQPTPSRGFIGGATEYYHAGRPVPIGIFPLGPNGPIRGGGSSNP